MAEDPANHSVFVRGTRRAMSIAEDIIYALAAALLALGALFVLAQAGYRLATGSYHHLIKAIESMLDSLLIVFIMVELLTAVREIMTERRLVGEPFLLVGIISAIREIVLLASFSGKKQPVTETALQIGVLGAIIVGLSLATFLLRRRHREPEE